MPTLIAGKCFHQERKECQRSIENNENTEHGYIEPERVVVIVIVLQDRSSIRETRRPVDWAGNAVHVSPLVYVQGLVAVAEPGQVADPGKVRRDRSASSK